MAPAPPLCREASRTAGESFFFSQFYWLFILVLFLFFFFFIFLSCFHSPYRLEKTASVIREAPVSRHNGGKFESPPETPQYDSAVMLEGFHEGPHDAESCVSDLCSFSSLGFSILLSLDLCAGCNNGIK